MVCGFNTNIDTAVELTMANEHDTKLLPELVLQTATDFDIREFEAIRHIRQERIYSLL